MRPLMMLAIEQESEKRNTLTGTPSGIRKKTCT